jgi:hypothetical protein
VLQAIGASSTLDNMVVAAGFTQISFFCENPTAATGNVFVYSNDSGTGTPLLRIALTSTGTNCSPNSGEPDNCWVEVTETLNTTAYAVNWSGLSGENLSVDNIAIGASTPGPASLLLLGADLLGLACAGKRARLQRCQRVGLD